MNTNKQPVKVVEDIPFFSEDRYWGKAPKAELEEALAYLEKEGWSAFKEKFGKKFDQTFEENRADWRFIVPLPENFTVLDAGAGMGRISIPLARVADKVTSMDHSFLRMKYLKMRAKYEGLENIEVCVGDIFDNPFPDESFDLIVMNGLLEWVGATSRFADPREAQLECLRIARKLLKKGGHLYIGIENRLALSYLHATDHSGLRYTSYMPRVLAHAYMALRKGRHYDTYTYTKKGYEKLLKDAGFSDTEFYLPYPGYNLPRMMIPYNNLKALSYAIRSKFFVRLYRYFFFSFGIVVRK